MPEQPLHPKQPRNKAAGKRPAHEPVARTNKARKTTSSRRAKPSRDASHKDATGAPRAAKKPMPRANRSTTLERDRSASKTSAHTHPRERPASETRSAGNTRRRLMRITVFLALPALVATAFLVLHTSLFAIGSVNVAGAKETSAAEIISIARLNGRPPLIDVNPVAVSTRIESLPWIKTAVVVRHWPKSVTIIVNERVPVAEASIRRHRWELFDVTGRALGFRSLRTAGLVRLRKIAPMPAPGSDATEALGGEVALADALPVALLSKVQEVTYSTSDELSLTLASGAVVIFGSAFGLSGKVVALSTLLADHVSLAGVTSINLRVPSSPVLNSAPPVTKVPVKTTKPASAGTTPTTTAG